ncbi:tRNA guanosine(34) transglycosylase Tgt [Candidatus Nomurabacteria bacterium]|nr:tRNA guanosine(34) transglycosylase Tgt [Candidatus Saccharibacteria bacterium]MCB9839760.1 tRNA guanosine(34) transglycosylase Tgt [Candidatus Nomurabacteria bacterium]
MQKKSFNFKVEKRIDGSLGRAGVINTPHGPIKTPAFIVVATKATVKALTPEQAKETGAQALLANAYHLYLRPGPEVVDSAGGLGEFMRWNGPTFTDSGGFQVLSLGAGFKKVITMDASAEEKNVTAKNHERLAKVDDEGVTFKSHIDGSMHRFTPEISMQIQHQLGADIIFAFDECTSIAQPYSYQLSSLIRTHKWADRCLTEHKKLTMSRNKKPYQALFGVIQGANYRDLRQQAAEYMGKLPFDGYGIGGALEKEKLAEIIAWVNEILPSNKPRHLLGLSEPDDIFIGIENGADTFDCVSPARIGRNGALYTLDGKINIKKAMYAKDYSSVTIDCACYTCKNYTKAYLNHLFRAGERLAATLATIHNEHFIIKLVDDIRESILTETFNDFKLSWLARYYGK